MKKVLITAMEKQVVLWSVLQCLLTSLWTLMGRAMSVVLTVEILSSNNQVNRGELPHKRSHLSVVCAAKDFPRGTIETNTSGAIVV